MHNTVVSKIRVYNPNKRGTAAANSEYCKYIATRPGVATEMIQDSNEEPLPELAFGNELHYLKMSDDNTYVNYIANRPRSHGLFGNIDTTELSKAAGLIKKNSQSGNPVYRGILSLAENDAMELGYNKAEKWSTLLHATMSDVAGEFNIPITRLQWVGAFHFEKGHPHVHYMFWDKEKVPRNSFIHVARQQRCREIFSAEIFQEERHQKVIDKTASRDLLIEYGKDIMSSAETLIKNPNLFIIQATKIPDKVYPKEIEQLSKQLIGLTEALPSKGRIAYAYMSPEIKDMTDKITESLLMRKDIHSEVTKYFDLTLEMTKTHSASQIKEKISQDNAYRDIKKRLGNVILKTAKSIRETDTPFHPEHNKTFSAIIDKLASSDNSYPIDLDKKISFTAGENYISRHLDYDIVTGNSIFLSPAYKKAVYSLKQFSETRHNHFLNKALDLLKEEAVNANPLALKKLGQIYKNNEVLSDLYNKKSAEALESILHMEPNNADAQHELGIMYASGLGTEQNYEKAFSLLKAAASEKETDAYLNYKIGNMYHYGKGVAPDDEQAVIYLEKAKALNHTYANNLLGKIYSSKTSPSFQPQLAEETYKASADQEDSFSQYSLAKLYLDQTSALFSPDKAVQLLQSASEQNYSPAQYTLGKLLLNDSSSLYNPDKAVCLLDSAARNGHAFAMHSLGSLYLDKKSKFLDLSKAESYSRSALDKFLLAEAESPDPFMEYTIGRLYLQKDLSFSDLEKASSFLQAAAEKGSPEAQYSLGRLLLDDSSSLYSPKKAVRWLESAAGQGHAFAMHSLGRFFMDKDSAFFDLNKAESYSRSALDKFLLAEAESPDPFMEYTIGRLYLQKDLSFSDLEKAASFLETAAGKGSPEAQYSLGKLLLDDSSSLYSPEKAVHCLESAAGQGHSFAMHSLGRLFMDKDSAFFDLSKAESYSLNALQMFLKAEAESPDPFMEYTIGKLYLQKDLSFSNLEKAASFLETAAMKDSPEAQYSLGRLLLDDSTKLYSPYKAVQWLQSSASQNNLYACLKLGQLHSTTKSHYYNIKKAEKYYSQAINLLKEELKNNENGSLECSLGQIYLNKELNFYNPSLAIEHFERAAYHDEAFAQYTLINIYLEKKSQYFNKKAANLNIKMLESTAASGDKISQYLLGKLHIFKILPDSSKPLGLELLEKSANQDYEPAQEMLQQEEHFRKELITRQSFKLIFDTFNCLTTDNNAYEQSLNNSKTHSKQVMREELRKSGIEPN